MVYIKVQLFILTLLILYTLGVVNGPLKNSCLIKFYPSLGISHNLLMGLGVSDFLSVGHIYAFLSSH